MQERAERCEPETLALVRARIKAAGAGAAADDTEQQYRMFEIRYRKRIRSETALAQCERYRTAAPDDHRRQFARMSACCAKESCAAFAECFLAAQ